MGNSNKYPTYFNLAPIFSGCGEKENLKELGSRFRYCIPKSYSFIDKQNLGMINYYNREKKQEVKICLECPPQKLGSFVGGDFSMGNYEHSWQEQRKFFILKREDFRISDLRLEFNLNSHQIRCLKPLYFSGSTRELIERGNWYQHFYVILCDNHNRKKNKTIGKILECLFSEDPVKEIQKKFIWGAHTIPKIDIRESDNPGLSNLLKSWYSSEKVKMVSVGTMNLKEFKESRSHIFEE